MLQEFWKDGRLSENSVNGIVKMVPKRSDGLDVFDNLQNLTMLTTTYKIIAKILAERLKVKVPNLVGGQ